MGSDEIHQARKERGQLWILILQAGCLIPVTLRRQCLVLIDYLTEPVVPQ